MSCQQPRFSTPGASVLVPQDVSFYRTSMEPVVKKSVSMDDVDKMQPDSKLCQRVPQYFYAADGALISLQLPAQK